MTIYQEIKGKLEKFPQFRERRFRAKYLAKLTLRALGIEEQQIAGRLMLDDLTDFASKYDSYRHEYDAVLKDCTELRGSDYPDGKALAQAKQAEFGYEVNYHNDIKKLATV